MKKIFTLLAATLIAATASAQRTVNLRVTIESPVANYTATAGGASFTQRAVVRNLGPGAIMSTDTFFYQDPLNTQGQVWFRVNQSKAVNDTILIVKSVSIPSTAVNGNYSYCVRAYVSNGAQVTADSAAFSHCVPFSVTGGTTGIASLIVNESVETQQINVFPNPAIGVVTLDYKAKNNSLVTARVIDITGREVMTTSFGKAYIGQSGYKLDISSLNTGIYFVELRQEGVRAIGRVSKN